jgi:putative ABC transport system permease protein
MVWNAFLLALRELRRNVLRSFLTILGIVIGVAAVIVMVTLGSGATVQVSKQIASLGSNVVMILPGQMGPGRGSSVAPFRENDVEAIRRDIGELKAVAPAGSKSVTAVFANKNWSTAVTGSTNDYFMVANWVIARGRTFTESEMRAGKPACVIGATVNKELFGAQDPLGNKLRLKNVSCKVIGQLEAKGQSAMGRDQDDVIIIPLRTFQRRISGNRDISLIQVSVRYLLSSCFTVVLPSGLTTKVPTSRRRIYGAATCGGGWARPSPKRKRLPNGGQHLATPICRISSSAPSREIWISRERKRASVRGAPGAALQKPVSFRH